MLRDEAPRAKTGGVTKARKLRREMSLPEVLLWRELRRRPHGLKFRRQHPSGGFVLDFYCGDARLAIEIDGVGHDLSFDRDEMRDTWFAKAGIETLRVAARAVLDDPARAADAIARYAVAQLPLHHPASPDGPPPRAELGEDR